MELPRDCLRSGSTRRRIHVCRERCELLLAGIRSCSETCRDGLRMGLPMPRQRLGAPAVRTCPPRILTVKSGNMLTTMSGGPIDHEQRDDH